MSAFSTLLALINAQINTNGTKAITGAKLNGVLREMVDELGSGYQFIDIATPATDPGTPDENVWYIATQAGTYTNFGGIIVNENEVCALVWNGSWTKKVTGAATAAQVNQLGQQVNLKIEALEGTLNPKEKKDRFYICDENSNVIAIIDSEGVHSVSYNMPKTKTIDNGAGDFVISDENGNVAMKIDKNTSIFDNIGAFIFQKYAVAQTCWIDDDFMVFDNGELRPQYSMVHDWCVENGVKLDFAFIPRDYTDGTDDSARIALAKSWENEGFRLLLHPIHGGWYDGGGETHDFSLVQTGIVKCIRFFKEQHFITNENILVYPGSSNKFADNVECIKQYVECAFTASRGSNFRVDNNRYQLQRYALTFDAVKTKTVVKQELKEFVDRGDWVILYTHLYNYDANAIADETTNSIANVLEVVGYLNSLCPLRATEAIWRERKFMFDYYNV